MTEKTQEPKSSFFSGFGNTLKGLVFEEEPSAQKPAAQPNVAATTTFLSPSKTFLPNTVIVGEDKSINQEMINSIKKKAVERQTVYTELLKSADVMAKAIPDAKARFAGAFSIIQEKGGSISSLISAIDVHISDVEGEKMKFDKSSQLNTAQEIGPVEKEIKTLTSSLVNNASEIDALQKRLSILQESITTQTEQLRLKELEKQSLNEKFDNVRVQFENAISIVKQELLEQKTVIQQMLSE